MAAAPPPPAVQLQIDPPHLIDTGAACATCFTTEGELLRCSACLHSWYCSQDCQRKHLKDHKSYCKVLKRFNALHSDLPKDIRPKNAKEFYIQRLNARQLLERIIKRPLSRPEARGIMNEAKCSVCMRTRDQLEGGALVCCPACHWGWSCPDHIMDYLGSGKHRGACPQFSLMNKCELWVHSIITSAGKLPTFRPETLQTTYAPLPVEGWREYRTWRPLPPLEPTMLGVFSKRLSQPLTVMMGLQHHYTQEELVSLERIVIHVMGASAYEVPADGVWEELLHLLPGLKELHMDFIGPEVADIILEEEDGMLMPKPVCEGCLAKGCKRTYAYHMCTYHDYIKRCEKQGEVQRPTLAIAFNSGMHDEDKALWAPSVKLLIDQGTPVMFTSYNVSEGEGDEAAFRSWGGHVTQVAARNPYHSLEPLPEPDCVDQFYHQSFYWFCGKGRQE